MHAASRPDAQLAKLFADGWPAFMTVDLEVKRWIEPVRELFADPELVLLDG